MEDDDEFGDLYTDVLKPFSSSPSSTPHPQEPPPAPPTLRRPIDLNLNTDDNEDDKILYGASHRNSPPHPSNQTLVSFAPADVANSARVSSSPDKKLVAQGLDTGDLPDFDIKEADNEGIIEDSGPIIPGLNVEDSTRNEAADISRVRDEYWDEEDSDSEDDLQIVLNETSHGPMGTIGNADVDDDDEDGDPLVIVADGDPNLQAMEEREWGVGDDSAAASGGAAEGERKEGGEAEAGKINPAVAGPKVGCSNHVYHHPFYSQYKVSLVVVVADAVVAMSCAFPSH